MIEKKFLAQNDTQIGKKAKASTTNTGEVMAVFRIEAPSPTGDITVQVQLFAGDDSSDNVGREITNGGLTISGKGIATRTLQGIQTNRQDFFLNIKDIRPIGAKVTCTLMRATTTFAAEEDSNIGQYSQQLQPAQMPDLYDPNKTIRHIYDCNAGASQTLPAPAFQGAWNSGTVTQVAVDSNRPCVYEFVSSTTASSGFHVSFSVSGAPPTAKPTLTVYFKMPAVIDANTNIQIGNHQQGQADRSGFDINGSTLQGKVVLGGVTTQSGGTYTMAADTWYIARIAYTNDSSAVCTLYSATGVSLYTFTITTAMYLGNFVGLRTQNSGTVAKVLCRLDMIELIIPINNRFYLSV